MNFAVHHPVKGHKTQEWQFISTQSFRELHKHIYCVADHLLSVPRQVTFKIGELKPSLSTKLEDVPMAVGEVYSYIHADCCEHMLILTDLRLISHQDSFSRSAYPRQVFACRTKRRKCEACLRHFAAVVSVDDELIGKPAAFLCEACFQGLHPEGKGEFKVYPYLHD